MYIRNFYFAYKYHIIISQPCPGLLICELSTPCTDVFTAVKDKLDKKKGLFEIVACDFMFSEDLEQNYLIEINMNPALFQSTEVLKTSIENVVYKT